MNEIWPKFAEKRIQCAFSIKKIAGSYWSTCLCPNDISEIGSYTYYVIWLNDITFTEYKIESGHIHVHHSITWVYVCTRVTGSRQCHILTLFYPRTMLFCVRAMTLTPISTSKIGLSQEIQSVQQYYSSITFKCEQTRTLPF